MLNASLKWRLAQFLEFRWWQRYLGKKDPDTYLGWKRSYWEQFLQRLGIPENELSRTKCLDAGCGPAGIFILLHSSAEVTALDPLIVDYELLGIFNSEDYPSVHFVREKLESYHPNISFDWIFCINAVNHVEHLKKAIESLASVLERGGRLVLSVDAHNHELLKWIFQIIPGDALHPHQLMLKDYKSLIEDCGLQVQKSCRISSGFVFDYYALILTKE